MEGDHSKRGTKRKRFELPEKDLGTKIAGKLHHDLKEVRKAAKKAKTFETQKLVKKLKNLRREGTNAQAVKESEAQLEALKHTDHERIAATALRTRLNKDRILSQNEYIQAAVFKEFIAKLPVLAIAGTPAAKVESRILSSKLLAVEVAAAVEDLKTALQPKPDAQEEEIDDGADVSPARPKKTMKPTDIEPDDDDNAELGEEGVELMANDEDAEGGEAAEEEVDESGWESGTVGDDEKQSDDGWESGSLTNEPIGSDDEDGVTSSESGSEGLKKGLQVKPLVRIPKKSAAPIAKTKATGGESTFLPSLAVGFVRGGSDDSEWSESEAKVADIDQKKNRRGQRARRAIWEKKYGRNANHKKKETEAAETPRGIHRRPDASTIRPTRAPSLPGGGKGIPNAPPQYHQPMDSGWGQRPNAGSASWGEPPIASRQGIHRTGIPEERPLHPSWEAKKKQKEKQSAGIVPSQGTKIKFS